MLLLIIACQQKATDDRFALVHVYVCACVSVKYLMENF